MASLWVGMTLGSVAKNDEVKIYVKKVKYEYN
jgi:hypothetical protein